MRCWATATRRAAALLLWLAPLPAIAAYQPLGAQFREGAWSGGAYSDAAGRQFESCAAQATLANGLFVLFELTRDGSFRIGMAHDGWQVTPGSRSPVTLKLDGVTARQDQAEGQQGLFVVTLERDKPLVDALKSARRLELVGSSSTVSIELAGSGGGRAVARLEDCLLQQAGVDASGAAPGGGGSSNPFVEAGAGKGDGSPVPANPFENGGGNPFEGSSPDSFDEADLVPLVESFLARAGIGDAVATRSNDAWIIFWESASNDMAGIVTFFADRDDEFWSILEQGRLAGGYDCPAIDRRDFDASLPIAGGWVHGGRLDCPGEDGLLYFAAQQSEGLVTLFLTFANDADRDFAQRVNDSIRALLAQN